MHYKLSILISQSANNALKRVGSAPSHAHRTPHGDTDDGDVRNDDEMMRNDDELDRLMMIVRATMNINVMAIKTEMGINRV